MRAHEIEQWVQVQAMWMYLEAVFTSGDIAKQLPQESKRFQTIDKNWVKIMTKANEQPIALLYIDGNDSLKQLLPYMLEQLELCQKALTEYLDMKKNIFPRFYFVSNMALLDILSNSNNPVKIMPHIGAVFDGIDRLTFAQQSKLEQLEEESLSDDEPKKEKPPTEASSMVAKGSKFNASLP